MTSEQSLKVVRSTVKAQYGISSTENNVREVLKQEWIGRGSVKLTCLSFYQKPTFSLPELASLFFHSSCNNYLLNPHTQVLYFSVKRVGMIKGN